VSEQLRQGNQHGTSETKQECTQGGQTADQDIALVQFDARLESRIKQEQTGQNQAGGQEDGKSWGNAKVGEIFMGEKKGAHWFTSRPA
jgi:hypothetical protein